MFLETEDISILSNNTLIIRHYLLHRKYSISKKDINKNSNDINNDNMEDIICEHNEYVIELKKRSLKHIYQDELDSIIDNKNEGHE